MFNGLKRKALILWNWFLTILKGYLRNTLEIDFLENHSKMGQSFPNFGLWLLRSSDDPCDIIEFLYTHPRVIFSKAYQNG